MSKRGLENPNNSDNDDLQSSDDTGTKVINTSSYRDYSRVRPDTDNNSSLTTQGTAAKEPTFPVKLHMILSNPEFEDIITWLPHGRSWRVLQQKAFEERVIPLYFRHARFSSFARQVNGWGFRRVTHGIDYNSYYHELFLRGKPYLCDRMRRLTTKDLAKRKNEDDGPSPDFYELSRENPLPESSAPEPSPPSANACNASGVPLASLEKIESVLSSSKNMTDSGTLASGNAGTSALLSLALGPTASLNSATTAFNPTNLLGTDASALGKSTSMLAQGSAIGAAAGLAPVSAIGATALAPGAALGATVGLAPGPALGAATGIGPGGALGSPGFAPGSALAATAGLTQGSTLGANTGLNQTSTLGATTALGSGPSFGTPGSSALGVSAASFTPAPALNVNTDSFGTSVLAPPNAALNIASFAPGSALGQASFVPTAAPGMTAATQPLLNNALNLGLPSDGSNALQLQRLLSEACQSQPDVMSALRALNSSNANNLSGTMPGNSFGL